MAEVKKSRIFLRRGTDASRLGTTLCEAELGYSTDGKRVFVGDDSTVGGVTVGSKIWVLDAGTDVTTLTSASGTGRAELGDLAWIPSGSYDVNTINSDAPSATITPASDTGLLYALSARNGAGDLTWVLANSGVPLSQIDMPDNGINGDKIHGGNISGDVTFSDSIDTASLTATNTKVHDLSGTGSRVVFAESDGQLSTSVGANVITSTEYITRVQITNTFAPKAITGTLTPQPADGDWTLFDLTSHLPSLPVTYPKAAIINVYHKELQAQGDRKQYGLYSSHTTSNYSTEGNFYLQARWGVGEDAGGSVDHYSWGSQYFVRMNGSSNNLILQYMLIDGTAGAANENLIIDLIGIQY